MCQALIDPGDTIAVEAPTYLGALMAFAGAEAEIVAVAMDDDGLRVDVLAERLAAGAAPEVPLHDPGVPEPDRADAAARPPPRAGRALPPARRADLRGRRLPRAVLRRRVAAVAVVARRPTSCCRRARSPRASSPACGSAGRPARAEVVAELAAAKQNTDQCAGGLGPAAARGVRPRRAASSATSRPPARCTRRTGRRCRRRWRATCPTGVDWTRADRAASSPGDAAAGARHARAAPGRARRRRGLRPRPAVPRRRRRRRTRCGCRSATSPRPSSRPPSSAWPAWFAPRSSRQKPARPRGRSKSARAARRRRSS